MTSAEITLKARQWRELQTYIKQLEEEAETLKTAIIAEMEAREVDTLQADVFTIKYARYQYCRLDAKALQEELPDVAARYAKISETRRFQVI